MTWTYYRSGGFCTYTKDSTLPCTSEKFSQFCWIEQEKDDTKYVYLDPMDLSSCEGFNEPSFLIAFLNVYKSISDGWYYQPMIYEVSDVGYDGTWILSCSSDDSSNSGVLTVTLIDTSTGSDPSITKTIYQYTLIGDSWKIITHSENILYSQLH